MTPAANESPSLRAAREFGANVIEAQAEAWDSAGTVPRQFFLDAGAAGLCGLLVPPARGGAGLDLRQFCAVLSILARHCMASTFALVVHNNLANAIARHGNPTQIDQYLGTMLRGECIGAFLLTEPGVGSDATAIVTRADKTADGWRVNGAKAWISNAAHADLLSVYVQTEAGAGARGIAGLLIESARHGVSREDGYDLLGGHALGTGGFAFNDCEVPDNALLFAPGEAFRAAMGGIDLARCSVAAMCCGILDRALEVALGYTAARPAFGAHVGDFQGVQWMLADCATDLEAARALTERAADALDNAAGATLAAAHAKKFATRVAFTRIADCMQVMGAAGLSRNYPLARHLAAAKIAQYLDGATEIQNVVIARALARRST